MLATKPARFASFAISIVAAAEFSYAYCSSINGSQTEYDFLD